MGVSLKKTAPIKLGPINLETEPDFINEPIGDIESLPQMSDAVVGPKVSLFERLEQLRPGLRAKILAYSLRGSRKLGVPPIPESLHEDVTQEISLAWAKIRANMDYGEGRTASFAHRIAWQTGLKVWRELGSAAKLPGNAFRKKSDGSTYVDIGAIAVPLSLNADSPEDRDWIDSMLELSDAGETEDEDSDTRLEQVRISKLSKLRKKLSPIQMRAVLLLLEGKEMPEIGGNLGLGRLEVNGLFQQIRKVAGVDLSALV